MIGISCGIIALGLAGGLSASHSPEPQLQQKKWLFFRGAFGTIEFLLVFMASRQGAPLGDIASLTSTNVVLAAVLGRMLLNEPLGCRVAAAAVLSISGAVLISRPAFLFGDPDTNGVVWMAYPMALGSGFMQACKAVAARKAASVSVEWHMLSSSTFWALSFIILPFTKVIKDNSTTALSKSPLEATGIICLLVTELMVYNAMACTGSKWCPVATSTTLYISSMMFCGYLVQTTMYDMAPPLITVVGAIFMLCSVFTMAAARVVQLPRMAAARVVQLPRISPDNQEAGRVDDSNDVMEMDSMMEDDIPSLTSFIATEFVEVLPFASSIRQRCNFHISEEEIGLPGLVPEEIGLPGLVAAAQRS